MSLIALSLFASAHAAPPNYTSMGLQCYLDAQASGDDADDCVNQSGSGVSVRPSQQQTSVTTQSNGDIEPLPDIGDLEGLLILDNGTDEVSYYETWFTYGDNVYFFLAIEGLETLLDFDDVEYLGVTEENGDSVVGNDVFVGDAGKTWIYYGGFSYGAPVWATDWDATVTHSLGGGLGTGGGWGGGWTLGG